MLLFNFLLEMRALPENWVEKFFKYREVLYLFDSLRALIATLVAMAHTRVELFGTEIEEELRRVVALLVGAIAVLALSSLALLFSALVVIVSFWDTHRVAAAASVAIGLHRGCDHIVPRRPRTNAARGAVPVVDTR